MDPDKALADCRKAVHDWENAKPQTLTETEAAERATGAFSALDDWLSKGGHLPAGWDKRVPAELTEAARAVIAAWDEIGTATGLLTGWSPDDQRSRIGPAIARLREVTPGA